MDAAAGPAGAASAAAAAAAAGAGAGWAGRGTQSGTGAGPACACTNCRAWFCARTMRRRHSTRASMSSRPAATCGGRAGEVGAARVSTLGAAEAVQRERLHVHSGMSPSETSLPTARLGCLTIRSQNQTHRQVNIVTRFEHLVQAVEPKVEGGQAAGARPHAVLPSQRIVALCGGRCFARAAPCGRVGLASLGWLDKQQQPRRG